MPKKINKSKKEIEKLVDYAADRLANILVQQLDYEKMKKWKMRKRRNQKFKVEVVYKETPDAKDRLRQLWDLLLSLPDPDKTKIHYGLKREN